MLRVVGGVAAAWIVLAILIAGGSGPAFEALASGIDQFADAEAQHQATTETPSTASVASLAQEGTLRVSGRTCSGQMFGSGFVLDGLLLTNRHLVAGATEFKVDNPANSTNVAPSLITVHRRASDLDLASGAPVGPNVFTAADQNAEVGDSIFVAGHAGGGETLVVAGTVHLYDIGSPWGYGGEVMLLDVSTTGGFSGGPVLDQDGRVVGMLQGFSPTLDLSIAIPIESITAWTESTGSAPVAACD